MRLLSGMKIFNEVGQDTWESTPLAASLIFRSPLTRAVIHLCVYRCIIESHRCINVQVQCQSERSRNQIANIIREARLH